jgi:FkbM family methyltransferase
MSGGFLSMIGKRLKRELPGGLELLKRQTRILLGKTYEWHYRHFSIKLPAEHLLPLYRSMHRTYDRFLPHLVRYLEVDTSIIDVGANCGDTLAGMYDANHQLNYICIEPDDLFFDYLSTNAERMRASKPGASIVLHKALVGSAVAGAILEGSGGTKHAVPSAERSSGRATIYSATLDSVVLPLKPSRVELIKSDVDGFDFDVIDSAVNLIAEHHPILFFECHFRDSQQKEGYRKTIQRLQLSGYGTWVVFDNFGDFVLKTDDVEVLSQLMDYVDRQNVGVSTRTIYYFDMMAATDRHASLLASAVSEYRLVHGSH